METSHGSAISFTWRRTGSWPMAIRSLQDMSMSGPVRVSADIRSNRKPSTCISVTQYRRESRISRSASGSSALTVLPQPVTSQ